MTGNRKRTAREWRLVQEDERRMRSSGTEESEGTYG